VYELGPGHISPQTRQHVCEVLRLSGPLDGELVFMLASDDGVLASHQAITFTFEAPEPESTFSTATMLGGGVGLFVLFAVLSLLLKRKGSDDSANNIFGEGEPLPTSEGPPVQRQSFTEPSTPTTSTINAQAVASETTLQGPPLPETGLPAGWTEEQWVYYGQQYLDGTL
jgi:hypothetical protein